MVRKEWVGFEVGGVKRMELREVFFVLIGGLAL